MISNRRGFLGQLAGLILGAVVGPKLIDAPSPEIWRAAKALPHYPRENEYVPLNQFIGRLIEIVHEETKWLRLERAVADEGLIEDWGRRRVMGETIMMRPPVIFTPTDYVDWNPRAHIAERCIPVPLTRVSLHAIPLDDLDWGMPLDRFSSRQIEPMGYKMAEDIAKAVKYKGGAGLMVSARTAPCQDVHKSVSMMNADLGLTIRGTIDTNHSGQKTLYADLLYGVA